MNTQEKFALFCMVIGFISLIVGIGALSKVGAAVVAGILLILFGIGLDKNAV